VKKLLASVAVSAALLAVAVPAFAATKGVKIGDNYFVKAGSKPTVSVKAGTTVKWTWTGSFPHNVTVLSGPQKFQSPMRTKGSYSRKVKKKGSYKIVCTIHPGMAMTLKVR